MSFAEMLEELPGLTVGQRSLLIRRALELDEPPFPAGDEALIDERLAVHRKNPGSAVPVEEVKARLRARFGNAHAFPETSFPQRGVGN